MGIMNTYGILPHLTLRQQQDQMQVLTEAFNEVNGIALGHIDLESNDLFTGTYRPGGILFNLTQIFSMAGNRAAVPWAPLGNSYDDIDAVPAHGYSGFMRPVFKPVGRFAMSTSLLGVWLHEYGHGFTMQPLTRALYHQAKDPLTGAPYSTDYDLQPEEEKFKGLLEAFLNDMRDDADWMGMTGDFRSATARKWFVSDYPAQTHRDYLVQLFGTGYSFDPWWARGAAVHSPMMPFAEMLAESFVGMALDAPRFRREYPRHAELVDAAVRAWFAAHPDIVNEIGEFEWPQAGEIIRLNRDQPVPDWLRETVLDRDTARQRRAPVSGVPLTLPTITGERVDVVAPITTPGLEARVIMTLASMQTVVPGSAQDEQQYRVLSRIGPEQKLLEAPPEGGLHAITVVLPDRSKMTGKAWVEKLKSLLAKDGYAHIMVPVLGAGGTPPVGDYQAMGRLRTMDDERRLLREVFQNVEVIWREGDMAGFVVSDDTDTYLRVHNDWAATFALASGSRILPMAFRRPIEVQEPLFVPRPAELPAPTWVYGEDDEGNPIEMPTLYHGTRIERALNIRSTGLEPRVGEWVLEAYGDELGGNWGEEEAESLLKPTSFLAPHERPRIVFMAILTHVEMLLDRSITTLDDILAHGAIAVFQDYDPRSIYRKAEWDEGIYDLAGNEDFGAAGSLSISIEANDYFTYEPQQATDVLVGERLLAWMLMHEEVVDLLDRHILHKNIERPWARGALEGNTLTVGTMDQVALQAFATGGEVVRDAISRDMVADVYQVTPVTLERAMRQHALAYEAAERYLNRAVVPPTKPELGSWVVALNPALHPKHRVDSDSTMPSVPWGAFFVVGSSREQALERWGQWWVVTQWEQYNGGYRRRIGAVAAGELARSTFATRWLDAAIEAIELAPEAFPGAPMEQALQHAVEANTFHPMAGVPKGMRETAIGPAIYATNLLTSHPKARVVLLSDLLALAGDTYRLLTPNQSRYFSLAFLAAALGFQAIEIEPRLHAIVDSEVANRVEAAALLSGPAERLEEVRQENPDLDFVYLHYRKVKA